MLGTYSRPTATLSDQPNYASDFLDGKDLKLRLTTSYTCGSAVQPT